MPLGFVSMPLIEKKRQRASRSEKAI